jgi:predicted nucleic acid-binding protein
VSDWPDLDKLPEDLRLRGEPDAAHLFFDTSSLASWERSSRILKQRGGGVISAMVFGELLAARAEAKHFKHVVARLRADRLLVADVDADVMETYWKLARPLQFDIPPLCGQGENRVSAKRRVLNDLVIFATSLRHRRLLVTENTRDFERFGMRDCWTTLGELAAAQPNSTG